MEGIGEDEFDGRQVADIFGILEHVEDHTFDRSFGPDWHKAWCRECDTIECDLTHSRISALGEYLEV